MDIKNKMQLKFTSKSENEVFARSTVACFALQLNPTLSQISDIKTAVSEAVTNSIVHGYGDLDGEVTIEAVIAGGTIHINVFDDGVGIENLSQAMEPFFTTKSEDERSGMGFTIMESFMDEVKVVSEKGVGTKVYMKKIIMPNN